jgi:hypothetical protein
LEAPGSSVTEQERREARDLLRFLEVFFDNYMSEGRPVPPEIHPMRLLAEIAAQSPRQALLGAKIAVADCIEMSLHWSPEQVRSADSVLRTAGAPTLTDMRRRIPPTEGR